MGNDETLEYRLDELLLDTAAIRALLDEENVKRDIRIAETKKSSRRARTAAIVGIVVGLLGVGAAIVAWLEAHDARHEAHVAQHALAVANATTASARLGACVQYNLQQGRDVDAAKAEIRVLTAQAKPGTEAIVKRFLHGYDKTVDDHYPLRDCTPAGIAHYLQSPQP